MDYFVWVAKSAERTFVIDCGFTEETAKKRKRTLPARSDRCAEARRRRRRHRAGRDPDPPALRPCRRISTASRRRNSICRSRRSTTRPAATCSIRGSRIPSRSRTSSAWCGSTSRTACMFHNGGAELAPGITLHPVGGHSMGLQFVQGAYQARLGRGRLRHHAFLREHDDRPPVHHGVPHRADAGGLRHAARERRRRRSTSCRATTRW